MKGFSLKHDYVFAFVGSFEKFLTDKIKVNGKTGVLGESIKVGRDKSKVTVTAEAHISKRWVKMESRGLLGLHGLCMAACSAGPRVAPTDLDHLLHLQVPEVSDQEVPEEAQRGWLWRCREQHVTAGSCAARSRQLRNSLRIFSWDHSSSWAFLKLVQRERGGLAWPQGLLLLSRSADDYVCLSCLRRCATGSA